MSGKTVMYVLVAALMGTSTIVAIRQIVPVITQVFANASSVLLHLP